MGLSCKGRGRGVAAMYGIHPSVPHRPDSTPFFLLLSCEEVITVGGKSCNILKMLVEVGFLWLTRDAWEVPLTDQLLAVKLSAEFPTFPFKRRLRWPFLIAQFYTAELKPDSHFGVCGVLVPDHALHAVVPAPCPEPCASVFCREGPGVPTVWRERPRPRYQWQELQESLEEAQHGVSILSWTHTRQQRAAETAPDDGAGAGGKVFIRGKQSRKLVKKRCCVRLGNRTEGLEQGWNYKLWGC